MELRRVLPLACCLLLGPTLWGCGSQQEKLTPVNGQVFYRGQPLAGGTIVFTPDAERGGHGPLACGEIGPDGRYALQTGSNPGAVPGWHRVTVAPRAAARTPDSSLVDAPIDLPRKYSDPEQSGLLREIKADKVLAHDFYLE